MCGLYSLVYRERCIAKRKKNLGVELVLVLQKKDKKKEKKKEKKKKKNIKLHITFKVEVNIAIL